MRYIQLLLQLLLLQIRVFYWMNLEDELMYFYNKYLHYREGESHYEFKNMLYWYGGKSIIYSKLHVNDIYFITRFTWCLVYYIRFSWIRIWVLLRGLYEYFLIFYISYSLGLVIYWLREEYNNFINSIEGKYIIYINEIQSTSNEYISYIEELQSSLLLQDSGEEVFYKLQPLDKSYISYTVDTIENVLLKLNDSYITGTGSNSNLLSIIGISLILGVVIWYTGCYLCNLGKDIELSDLASSEYGFNSIRLFSGNIPASKKESLYSGFNSVLYNNNKSVGVQTESIIENILDKVSVGTQTEDVLFMTRDVYELHKDGIKIILQKSILEAHNLNKRISELEAILRSQDETIRNLSNIYNVNSELITSLNNNIDIINNNNNNDNLIDSVISRIDSILNSITNLSLSESRGIELPHLDMSFNNLNANVDSEIIELISPSVVRSLINDSLVNVNVNDNIIVNNLFTSVVDNNYDNILRELLIGYNPNTLFNNLNTLNSLNIPLPILTPTSPFTTSSRLIRYINENTTWIPNLEVDSGMLFVDRTSRLIEKCMFFLF